MKEKSYHFEIPMTLRQRFKEIQLPIEWILEQPDKFQLFMKKKKILLIWHRKDGFTSVAIARDRKRKK